MLYSVQIEVAGVLSKLQLKLEEYDTILWKKNKYALQSFSKSYFPKWLPSYKFFEQPRTDRYLCRRKQKKMCLEKKLHSVKLRLNSK